MTEKQPIFKLNLHINEQEIKNSINKVEGLGGMTVNERLFASGLMDEFERALISNKSKAEKILELLGLINYQSTGF
jgi:hypothetical protein